MVQNIFDWQELPSPTQNSDHSTLAQRYHSFKAATCNFLNMIGAMPTLACTMRNMIGSLSKKWQYKFRKIVKTGFAPCAGKNWPVHFFNFTPSGLCQVTKVVLHGLIDLERSGWLSFLLFSFSFRTQSPICSLFSPKTLFYPISFWSLPPPCENGNIYFALFVNALAK